MAIYIQCFFISLVGLGFSMLTILRSLKNKAATNNLIFDKRLYWNTDLWIQIAGTMLSMAGSLLLLHPFLEQYPEIAKNNFKILLGFLAIGYMGSDLASRFFSVVNSKLNNASAFKSKDSDTNNGTTDAPTPAV